MQVKLVFEKSYQELRGLSSNTFSEDIDVELPKGFDSAYLVSAICYDTQQGSDYPTNDSVATIWDYTDEQRLIGKLLTYIDATYIDREQREAHKSLIKDMVYGYYSELKTRASQIISSQSNPIVNK